MEENFPFLPAFYKNLFTQALCEISVAFSLISEQAFLNLHNSIVRCD